MVPPRDAQHANRLPAKRVADTRPAGVCPPRNGSGRQVHGIVPRLAAIPLRRRRLHSRRWRRRGRGRGKRRGLRSGSAGPPRLFPGLAPSAPEKARYKGDEDDCEHRPVEPDPVHAAEQIDQEQEPGQDDRILMRCGSASMPPTTDCSQDARRVGAGSTLPGLPNPGRSSALCRGAAWSPVDGEPAGRAVAYVTR